MKKILAANWLNLVGAFCLFLFLVCCSTVKSFWLFSTEQIVIVNKCYNIPREISEQYPAGSVKEVHSWPVAKRDSQGNLLITCGPDQNDK